ncbi:hypothetical protein [Gracilimonas mengyeensis]|uniref:Uncharacterized protein n=1 Tax=Gracilimonas mengyeensis TaxID=1302730 RepID=A0A521F467_9BACT|nr:hypothetical protein [Gracilimonas mengyeensis]SMO90934.1 hypothetical protein SAMN06265219_11519 [Gracilimonas mengyeensis]
MGRDRTGNTTKETRRIELSYLLKKGFIREGNIIAGQMNWTDGSRISIECHYTDKEQYIRLFYTLTSWEGKETDYDYKIQLTFVPSNLGKGKVPYFVCPESGNRCRILYKAYGSPIWKSRGAYNRTIFYPSQVSSKIYKYCDEYWRLDKQIKKLEEETRNQTHYNGKPTRRFKRLERLREKQQRADYLRFTPAHMPKVLRDNWPDFEL